MPQRIPTADQQALINEFVSTYELRADQISFENGALDPIFDYPALSILRLKLTDIQDAQPVVVERNTKLGIVTVSCTFTLQDGRTAGDVGSAQYQSKSEAGFVERPGEIMPDGSVIETILEAQAVAAARAYRRGLRAAGIDIMAAHRRFIASGKVTAAEPEEFNSRIGREIHKLANDWGHIRNGDKSQYQLFLKKMFGEDKDSCLKLDDIQRSQLVTIYQNMIASRQREIEKNQQIAAKQEAA